MKRQKLKKKKLNQTNRAALSIQERTRINDPIKNTDNNRQMKNRQSGNGQSVEQKQRVQQRPANLRRSRISEQELQQKAARKQAIEMQQLLQDVPKASDKIHKKMRDQAKAENSSRHKKRRRRNRSLYYIIVFIFILITAITLSVTVFFNIKQLVVNGSNQYTAQELAKRGNVAVGDNLFRLNLSDIEDSILKQSIDIDDITVKRSLPETLRFDVTPAKPELVVYCNKQYYILSSGGRLIAITTSLKDYQNLPIISDIDLSKQKIGEFVNENEDYSQVIGLLKNLKSHKITEICGISVKNSVEISVNIDQRICLQLGNEIGLDDKLLLAKQLLKEEISDSEYGVLDISQQSKAYFRPMNKKELKKVIPKGQTVSS